MAGSSIRSARYVPVGAHTSIVPNTAQGITVPTGATGILMQARTQNARFTLDGTTPTATVGFQLATTNLDVVYLPLAEATRLMVISETAGAVFQFQFVKEI